MNKRTCQRCAEGIGDDKTLGGGAQGPVGGAEEKENVLADEGVLVGAEEPENLGQDEHEHAHLAHIEGAQPLAGARKLLQALLARLGRRRSVCLKKLAQETVVM